MTTEAAAPPERTRSPPPQTLRTDARFWRVSFALFLSGLATFALLYCVQPILPAFVQAFALTPGRGEPVAVGDDRRARGRDVRGGGAVRRLRPQDRDGRFARRGRRGDAGRGARAELADADRGCAR